MAREARAADEALKRNDYAAAVSFAERAAKSAPKDAELWFLLGYADHAHYALADSMAHDPAAASALMRQLWAPGKRRAAQEAAELQALIDAEGGDFRLDQPGQHLGVEVGERDLRAPLHAGAPSGVSDDRAVSATLGRDPR